MSVCICPKPVTAGAGLLFRIIFIFIFTLLLGFDLSFAFLFTFEAFFLLLLNGRLKNGRFRFLLLYPLIFVQAAQLCSVFVTGRYIEPLTLWNLSSASSVGAETQVKLTFIAVLFLAVSLPPHRLRIQKVRTFAWIMAIWGAGELCFDNFPLRAAAVTAGQVYNQLAYNPAYDDGSRFYRKNVVEEGKSSWQNEMTKKKNVILIFAEGMSSEVISEKLTPHTFELRDRSVSFENYYNHTAATFRGIRGQLISGFQLLGGSYGGQGIAEINKKAVDEHFKGRTESLPLILRRNGYQTVFLSPHPESDNFQTFVKGIGFDEVIGSKTAQNWSDRRLYENLFAEAQRLAEQKRPFLLATYVLGTHVGLDSSTSAYDDEQLQWLDKTLAKIRPQFKYCVIFSHVPPVNVKVPNDHRLFDESRDRFAEVIRNRGVNLLISGHVHYYSESEFAGVPLITLPSSGQPIRSEIKKFGYVMFKADRDGIAKIKPVYVEAGDDMEHWEAFMSSALVDEDINFFSVWVFCAGVVLLFGGKILRL